MSTDLPEPLAIDAVVCKSLVRTGGLPERLCTPNSAAAVCQWTRGPHVHTFRRTRLSRSPQAACRRSAQGRGTMGFIFTHRLIGTQSEVGWKQGCVPAIGRGSTDASQLHLQQPNQDVSRANSDMNFRHQRPREVPIALAVASFDDDRSLGKARVLYLNGA